MINLIIIKYMNIIFIYSSGGTMFLQHKHQKFLHEINDKIKAQSKIYEIRLSF